MFTVSVRLQETFPSEKSKYVKNMSKRVVHVLFVWWHILYRESMIAPAQLCGTIFFPEFSISRKKI